MLDETPGSIDPLLVSMLLGVMPLTDDDAERIRNTLARLAEARDAYHAAIVQAHNNGASVRDIAAILDVSHQTVHNIIRAAQG